MMFVDGQADERLLLDGEWLEKLWGGLSKTRAPASSFRGVTWQEIDRKVKRLVQVTLEFEGGPFVGLVAAAEKRPELEAFVAGLEAARGV